MATGTKTKGTRTAATAPDRAAIIDALRASYEGPAWHGPSVRIALRGVSAERAAAVPAPGRNAIWEIVLHLAYGRHRLLHRLRSLHDFPLPSFPRKLRKSWFPELPDPLDERRWKEDQALLARYQERLLDVLDTVPGGVLLRVRGGSERPIGVELLGLALHDAYHAGQIRLLDRLATR
jgi:hypothetical protein